VAELDSQQIPIQSVYTWYREDKLYVNRRYQRKLVWTIEEKQKLIESILKKYPVPAILIADRDRSQGTYEIIDGLQRLQAMMAFIETAFSTLDGIEPKKIGKRFVVGVNREAKVLGLSVENYFSKWKDAIKSSKISSSLKNSVLSNMDFNSFYGLGIIVITIPPQKQLSYLEEEIYWRNGDATELAKTPKQIAMLAQRF
jgi:uncharacterized protein with ParB-like and HNH nuclease domain